MAAREMSTDDFLNHRTAGGGSVAMLGKWKDREGDPGRKPVPLPGRSVDVWLHTKCGIYVVWRHPWPRRQVTEDKETGEQKVVYYGGNKVCLEEEEVLRRQRYRNDDGSREAPPCRCALCKFNEWLRGQVVAGAVGWTQPVFRFKGTESVITLRAGGMYGDFDKKDKTDAEVEALANVGIRKAEAWKESAVAKASYIFRVVDHDHPEAGVQVAVETSLVGDKTKIVIRDQKQKWGVEDGDPRVKPYAIRWQHRPQEQEFGKKYHALPMESLKLTPEVAKLIEGPYPNIDHLVEPYNAKSLYHDMRNHCLLEGVPWEQFFGPLDKLEETADEKPKAPPPTARPQSKAEAKPPEMFACDACGKPMAATANKCPHCGEVYDVEEEAPTPAPEPPPLPKRSAAKKAAAASTTPAAVDPTPAPKRSAATKPSKKAPDPTPPDDFDYGGGGDDDDLPF